MTELVKPPLRLKKRQLSSKQKQQPNFSLGSQGEQRALQYLQQEGYQVLDANVRVRNQEVDLIVFDPKTRELVFVEVKTRSSARYGHPSHAVNHQKLRSLQSVAQRYCREKKMTYDYRFDVISILPGHIDHAHNISWGMVK